MKKKHIRILIVVMSAALLGLLAVQWFWVRNAVSLRERQFQGKVAGALERVVDRLQDHEIAYAITGGEVPGLPMVLPPTIGFGPHPGRMHPPANMHPECPPMKRGLACGRPPVPPSLSQFEPDGPGDPWASIRMQPGHIQHRSVTMEQYVNGRWEPRGSQQTIVAIGDSQIVVGEQVQAVRANAYAHGFVERMLRMNRPIYERLNLALLDTLIKLELHGRGVEEPYVYNVQSSGYLPTAFREEKQFSLIDEEKQHYRARLFPHDLTPTEHFLVLQFPDHATPTMRAMGLVLPTSGILVVIVMACFGIALVAFRRQQRLSDLKTDFINNMTHELKTPISTISLALEALGDPDMQTAERIAMYARVIGQENERLKTQVERVLQAAALERGELKLDLMPVDMDILLCDQIERIRIHVEARGGHIFYEPTAEKCMVLADEVHLGGIIFNLLDNANKYSPSAPAITVRTRNGGGGIYVDVSDKGLGISPEAQRDVFEKFYRVPTGNVHDVKGFGIGLSYARSMARAHGGDITLVSEQGQGSTFTLYIPQKSDLE